MQGTTLQSSDLVDPDPQDFPTLPPGGGSRQRRWRHWLSTRAAVPFRVLGPRPRNAFGILTYHRVSPDVRRDPAMLNVPPVCFREQIEGLLALGYSPWPLRKLIAHHTSGRTIPRNAFAIVFDDGYSDLYHGAWPVLKKSRVPATVFLVTAYLDADRFPFVDASDTGAHPLSTEQCIEMSATGLMELGSHTHWHTCFRRREERFCEDLSCSVALLASRFGVTNPTFSFPYGYYTPRMIDAARAVGLTCGLTAECDLVTPSDDPFRWGRFGATSFDTPRTLAAKLDGWYSLCRTLATLSHAKERCRG